MKPKTSTEPILKLIKNVIGEKIPKTSAENLKKKNKVGHFNKSITIIYVALKIINVLNRSSLIHMS